MGSSRAKLVFFKEMGNRIFKPVHLKLYLTN